MLAERGVIATYASQSDPTPTVSVFSTPPPELRSAIDELTCMMDGGVLNHPPMTVFPLADSVAAHRLLESSSSPGKIVLTVP